MAKKCPYKPPKPPRCFYRTKLDWLIGRVSPSLHLHYAVYCFTCGLVDDKDAIAAKRFFKARELYIRRVLEWKVENRTCNRDEWKRLKKYRKDDRP